MIGRPLALSLLVLTLSACGDGRVRPSEAPDRAGEVLPAEPEALLEAAETAYSDRNWQTAEAAYRELARQVPREIEPWFRLGNIYARTDRPEAAVDAYKEALVRDPGLAKAWHNMATVHLRQAANAFLQLRSHVKPESPEDLQAAAMYRAIIDLMGEGTDQQ